jgi:hypothetical protein
MPIWKMYMWEQSKRFPPLDHFVVKATKYTSSQHKMENPVKAIIVISQNGDVHKNWAL